MPLTPESRPPPDNRAAVDAGPPRQEPVEERLAHELSTDRAEASAARTRALAVLRRLGRYDRAVYRSVARLSTPLLDEPLRRVSGFANFSKPWFITAGFLALFGGAHGRRAALTGLAAVGATSLVVNQPMKLIGERHRPDRDGLGVPLQRWVAMPSSTSFPSGHSASAAAFAVAVGDLLPALKLPLRAAASVVAFSRVYTGVHYPSDVLVGATVGALLGRVASTVARRARSAPGPAAAAWVTDAGYPVRQSLAVTASDPVE
jgi:membrane-associated phospholipid phosphatase